MSKSVYSLVLSDEVVTLIDNAALKSGQSRSQLVNRILAQYVGYNTKEDVISEILDIVSIASENHCRMRVIKRQQSSIDFLSAIDYKYNPRVTYTVGFNTADSSAGELKIALRTTNEYLLSIINEFFVNFISIESKYLPKASYRVVDGKLLRTLDFSKVKDNKDLALKLHEYVNNIDKLINLYIADYPLGSAADKLEKNYLLIKDKIIF